ncbi:MAG: sugar transferase [Clostridia bacterium]|nr:sugar transferase [Clostridia bacterium]
MYAGFFKRLLDFLLSLTALLILSPVLVVLTLLGAIQMRGNPFFLQARPGKNGRIFYLIKFRSMTNKTDSSGALLPDAERLTAYGQFLRSTSLDELPELINILKGEMSIVGPRPLAVQYLPYYNEIERRRHEVTPGLTGLAQVNGRNATSWEQRFAYDVEYVDNISLKMDVRILLMTVKTVFCRTGIGVRGVDSLPDFDAYRKEQMEKGEMVEL